MRTKVNAQSHTLETCGNLCSQMLPRISDIAPIVLPVRHNSNDYRTGIVRRSLAPTACAGTEPVHRKKAIHTQVRLAQSKVFAAFIPKGSAKCGFRPCLCQIRRTLFSLRPAAFAILRVLQRVALMGRSCVVFRITSCTLAGVIVGGLPGRAFWNSAIRPRSRNRFRQRAAVSGVMFNLAAIC
jgi:hypothetical protein